jgi:uncharacterized cupin superfamily protein
MSKSEIIRLNAAPPGFGDVADELTQDMFDSKIPVQHSHEYFADETLGLYVGVWDTTDMIETAGPYPCDEFMWLLKGEAQIRNCRSGAMEKALAGEPFVIPAGYECQWHQSGYLQKFFLIYENPAEPVPQQPAVEGIVIPQKDAPMRRTASVGPFVPLDSSVQQQQFICYQNHPGTFQAGTWETGPFVSTKTPFPHFQLSHVIEGELTLTDQDGAEHGFNPGDTFFVPAGVVCSAIAQESIRMFFARVIIKNTEVLDAPASAS